MSLSSGARLGVYEILAKLGEGGMGEVYRARDTRLKRDVAIKVLPDQFARDPDRLTRFEREAELLATLNHPNIGSVYGFEEASSASGIVLELVEGPTLADRIAQGAVPVDEALSIARQVADALESAHQKGIVHRDLKPANIKFTAGGQVKVLDFGLAKAMESAAAPAAAASISPTMVSPATQAGIIVGTAAYMSPEQARGKAVDQRADIWAFGCVMFEMLTGQSPFGSVETVSDSIAAILTREPEWNALPPDAPTAIRRLLRRCIEKDVSRRLHHIGDARLELDDASGSEAAGEGARPIDRPRWQAVLPWGIAAFGVVAALVAILWSGRGQSVPPAPLTRLELTLPPNLELYTAGRTMALSPDGSQLAFIGTFSGTRDIYLRKLDQFETVPLRGTDGVSTLFYSADGTSIGFVTSSGVLKTVSLVDGVVTTEVDGAGFLNGGAWGADDSLVFPRGATLWRMQKGGEPKQLTTLDATRGDARHGWPMFLPGGGALLFTVASNQGSRIDSLDLNSNERRTVVQSGTLPMYTSSGHLVYFRDGQMLAAPFDAASATVTGSAVPLLNGIPVLTGSGGNAAAVATEIPLIDVSLSGTVMYSATTAFSSLVWVSRKGEEQVLNGERRSYANPRMAVDGQRVMVQAGDLWVQDLARGTFSRLTAGSILTNGFPIWMPDGRVMYRSSTGLRIQGTRGPGDSMQMISGTTEVDYPGAVAADGDTLVFLRSTEETSFNILTLSLRDPAKVKPFVQTPAYEGGARLSPDGKWLTYVSNETGRNEVYITPFPGPGDRTQISIAGGTQAVWNPSGKEIFFRLDDRMMAVQVTTAPALTLSSPVMLFEGRYAYGAGITIPNFDVTLDGQRFVMVKPESGAGRLNVVLNWFANRPAEP